MAEWSKAHAWKVCRRVTVSRVRIPVSPPDTLFRRCQEMSVDLNKVNDFNNLILHTSSLNVKGIHTVDKAVVEKMGKKNEIIGNHDRSSQSNR